MVVLLYLGTAFAQECDLPEAAVELDIAGFGVIRVGTLDGDGEPFFLSDGVCVEGVNGWLLTTSEAVVDLTEGAFRVEVGAVTLTLVELTLSAESLIADETELVLTDLQFGSGQLNGRADEGRYHLTTEVTTLLNPSALGDSFSVAGSRAEIVGERLTFHDAVATTCVCAETPFYVVNADTAVYELSDASISVRAASLDVAGLSIGFEELKLSQETFSNFTFPIVIEYIADDANGTEGTGLGIRIPNIPAGDGLSLELGLQGLDVDKPLSGVLLARYKDTTEDTETAFTIGIAEFDTETGTLGSQADFAVTRRLMSGLSATFGINNRHWKAQDYLHEGYFGLEADTLLVNTANSSLTLEAGTLLAASSQGLPADTVADARLAANGSLVYKTSPAGFGNLSLRLRGDGTYYPGADRSQVALTLQPRWHGSLGVVRTELNYTRRFSNEASPFSTKLDRLEPVNRLTLSLAADDLTAAASDSFRFASGYDFLETGVDLLTLSAGLEFDTATTFSVRPFLNADLARLLNTHLDEERRAHLELGTDLLAERWETGVTVRTSLDPFAFDKLEGRVSFPLDLGAVQLQPFVALDVLPSLTASALPRISGHGLKVTWPTCCGTLIVGYRQVDNRFTTSLAVQLDSAVTAQVPTE